jgi:hypothetical protein
MADARDGASRNFDCAVPKPVVMSSIPFEPPAVLNCASLGVKFGGCAQLGVPIGIGMMAASATTATVYGWLMGLPPFTIRRGSDFVYVDI